MLQPSAELVVKLCRFESIVIFKTLIHVEVWYQSRCPGCCLHAGPGPEREFWMAGDTAELNSPAGERTEDGQEGNRKREERVNREEGRTTY